MSHIRQQVSCDTVPLINAIFREVQDAFPLHLE